MSDISDHEHQPLLLGQGHVLVSQTTENPNVSSTSQKLSQPAFEGSSSPRMFWDKTQVQPLSKTAVLEMLRHSKYKIS